MFATLTTRTAATTMAIYFTNRVGVWGNTDVSDKLYQGITNGLEPVRQLMPFKIPEVNSEFGLMARQYYDRGVEEGMQLMRQVPNYTGQLLELAMAIFLELANSTQKKTTKSTDGHDVDDDAVNWQSNAAVQDVGIVNAAEAAAALAVRNAITQQK